MADHSASSGCVYGQYRYPHREQPTKDSFRHNHSGVPAIHLLAIGSWFLQPQPACIPTTANVGMKVTTDLYTHGDISGLESEIIPDALGYWDSDPDGDVSRQRWVNTR